MKTADRFVFMSKTITVSSGGKTVATDPLKFNFLLDKTGHHPLIDAYVGVEFSVVYKVTVRIVVSGKTVEGKAEFYCNVPGSGIDPALGKRYVPQDFNITPEGIAAAAKPGTKVPKFQFYGQISSTNCCFNEPFDGYLICKESELQIKSIEIQLVRVETFEDPEKPIEKRLVQSATEVQNIQVADGNVMSDLQIPLYMLFPKIYSCSTYVGATFKIEFHVNLIVIFYNGY
jgi:hypothetical protein